MNRSSNRRMAGVTLAALVFLPCCTTYMRPVPCGDRERVCGELHDAKFCENLVVAMAGADCASFGLIVGKPFCFVSTSPCVRSGTYALKDRDCVIREYTPVREWYACSPGTPTFRF